MGADGDEDDQEMGQVLDSQQEEAAFPSSPDPVLSARLRHEAQKLTQEKGRLPAEERDRVAQVFQSHCEDGHLSLGEDLVHVVHDLAGQQATDQDVKVVMQHLEEADGSVSLGAFHDAVEHWYLTTPLPTDEPGADSPGGRPPAAVGSPASPDNPGSPEGSKESQLVLETFNRYSKTSKGVVLPDDLREMMADLNSGIYPADQEVRHVMWFADTRQRGFLDVKEFESAATFWYIHTMEERERAKAHCCVIL